MRVIPAGLHRVLDVVTVVAFALAPSVLGLAGLPALLAYGLAVVHLAMTLLTRFPADKAGAVPLGLHAAVELVVGIVLIALPWVLHWQGTPRAFYFVAGAVILLVWALSRYGRETGATAVG
jgi:hypothetical protein